MKRLLVFLVPLAACAAQTPGYNPSRPTELTCGCDEADKCYELAGQLSESKGENAATGEQLLYFSQCACLEGSFAGCNTLGHFAKDFVARCEGGDDVKDACTIAGFIYLHGAIVPQESGRSFDHDPVASKAAFARACAAGAPEACAASKSTR